jgi:hypothetical protein
MGRKFDIGDIVTDDGKYRWVVITDNPLKEDLSDIWVLPYSSRLETYGMIGISNGNFGAKWMHMAENLEHARSHPGDKALKELVVLLYG